MNEVTNSASLEDVIGEVAEEFSQRVRRGESPDVEDYAQRYPDAAEKLRRILPALALVVDDDPTIDNSVANAVMPIPVPQNGVLGDYRLRQEIGRGGMGVVYEAEQISLSRRVALKILPFAAVLDQRQIQRFKNEAIAAGQLDHPNIVDVYSVGCERSIHFYAMRFVEGEPLSLAINQLKQAGKNRESSFSADSVDDQSTSTEDETKPLAALSTERTASGREFFRNVAKIGVQVAEALDHAHQQGVVHRDVKPANIIIDCQGKPWVTDFGLARLDTGTVMTMTGDLLGTLRYMSPEQALAKRVVVDHRTDIYSLGVTLYELLTLEAAFPGSDRQELLRRIAFEDPRRPMRLNGQIPEPIETIILKTIRKNPNERYETAQELADDLKRFLDDQPIHAKRPGPVKIARHWARRHSTLIAASVLVLLLTTIAAGTAAVLIAQEQANTKAALAAESDAKRVARQAQSDAEQARDQELALRQEAQRQQSLAEANFSLARSAVDQFLDEVTENDLLTVPGFQPLRVELLTMALDFYERFSEEDGNAADTRFELGQAQYRLARIYHELARSEEAKSASVKAIERFELMRNEGDNSLDVQLGLMQAYFWAGRRDDTVTVCNQILEMDPQQPEARWWLADTYNAMGALARNRNEQLSFYQKALRIQQGLVDEFPEHPKYLAGLGRLYNNIGNKSFSRQVRMRMYEHGAKHLAAAYEENPHYVKFGRDLATVLRNAASNYQEIPQQWSDALGKFEQIVEIRRRLEFENPAIAALKGELHQAWTELAEQQLRMGLKQQANRSVNAAREILESLPREKPEQMVDLAIVYSGLVSPDTDEVNSLDSAASAADQGNADEAMTWLTRAVDAGYKDRAVLESNQYLDSLRQRIDYQALLNRLKPTSPSNASSLKLQDQRITRLRQQANELNDLIESGSAKSSDENELAAKLHSVGLIEIELGNYRAAEEALSEALRIRESRYRESKQNAELTVDLAAAHVGLGNVFWLSNQTPDALARWKTAMDLLDIALTIASQDERVQSQVAEQERNIFERYGQIGLWEKAAEYAIRNLEKRRLTHALADSRFSVLLAACGEMQAHDEYTTLFFDQLRTTSETWDAWVNPNLALPVEQVLAEAEWQSIHGVKFRGAHAYYRAGHYAQAKDLLLQSQDVEVFDQQGYFWLAMTCGRLGELERSHSYLDQAEATFNRFSLQCLMQIERGEANGLGPWWRLAATQLVRREAWSQFHGVDPVEDPWRHAMQSRGWEMIGEVARADEEFAAALADYDALAKRLPARADRLAAEKAFLEAIRAAKRDEIQTAIDVYTDAATWWVVNAEENQDLKALHDSAAALMKESNSPQQAQLEDLLVRARYESLKASLWDEWFGLAKSQAADKRFSAAAQNVERAIPHWDGLPKSHKEVTPLLKLAEQLADQQEWGSSLLLYDAVYRSLPNSAWLKTLGYSKLMAEGRDAYRDWCSDRLARIDEIATIEEQRALISLSFLVPDLFDDYSTLIDMARKLEDVGKENWGDRMTVAVGLIRDGRPHEAIPILHELEAKSKEGGFLYWLSIAYLKVGEEDSAQQFLKRADQWAQQYTASPREWRYVFRVKLMQQEAHQALGIPLPEAEPLPQN